MSTQSRHKLVITQGIVTPVADDLGGGAGQHTQSRAAAES
jgi:hypothetical protein